MLVNNLLTDPDTKGNQTTSALKAGFGNGKNYNSAKATASETLARPNVIQYMNQLTQELGLGTRVQLVTLRDIITGESQTVTQVPMADGVIREYKRGPTATERVKAIDILNKMTGHYAAIRVHESAAIDRYRELAKRLIDQPARRASLVKPASKSTRRRRGKALIREYAGIIPVVHDTEATIDDVSSSDESYKEAQ